MNFYTLCGSRRAAGLVAITLLSSACELSTDADDANQDVASVQQATWSHDLGDDPSFTVFEAGQVRPLALSPDGSRLFAANTPDNRLEIYRPTDDGLVHCGSVAVGLEPVAVAARSSREVWVVNHLSDSVSIVRLRRDKCRETGRRRRSIGRVARTLLVGDEPRDIVFAGHDRRYVFVTTAHRGQNTGFDSRPTTPGIGRADVWVFDRHDLGDSLAGEPANIINLFTDKPRALAVSADGMQVFAAGFHTGNQTTPVFEQTVTAGGGTTEPRVDTAGVEQPATSLIVKFDGLNWVDDGGRVWDEDVKLHLPDKDVFVIDASAHPPVAVGGADGTYAGVGTVLFNMAVNPVTGAVYVSNTDASNDQRFEGPGISGERTVRGEFSRSRITVLRGGDPEPRHLNKHIDYSTCCAPLPNDENDRSVASPTDLVVSADGRRLYVAAFGSSEVAVYDTSDLEDDDFVPDTANQIAVTGGGPSGLALDEDRGRLYVLTRFDNSIAIVDTAARAQIGSEAMHNPEPATVVEGRPFLYDASATSSRGDSACASCHVFGDMDSLAWDLGNPDATTLPNLGPFRSESGDTDYTADFHALKGPMTTQSLRGLANHGPMHWRGDRTGGKAEIPNVQPNSGTFDEVAAFKAFNVAFVGLLGRSEPLSAADMQAFTDFALQITYPPNPYRSLDNSLTDAQQRGSDLFFDPAPIDGFFGCSGCHVTNPTANPGEAKPGFFGTDGQSAFVGLAQNFKVPHLRNLYQKVGKFGMAESPFFLPESLDDGEPNANAGEQVRGFGFLHDGSVDTVFRFHGARLFQRPDDAGPEAPGIPFNDDGIAMRRDLEQFLLAFDSNLAPVVGQQVTLGKHCAAEVDDRIDLLMERADAGECELVAKRRDRGFIYTGGGYFATDYSFAPWIPDWLLRYLGRHWRGEVTYTCVPRGSGRRIGVDRDLDGVLDGDERILGSDPADPSSRPW